MGGRADRAKLEHFADVLNAPELVDLIPQHQITLTCRWCPKRVEGPPWWFRRAQKIGGYQSAEIDWELRKGTFTCTGCASAQATARNGNVVISRMIKKGGRRLVRDWFLKRRQLPRPPSWAGRKVTPEAKWLRSISLISPRPRGRWADCRICGFLLHHPREQPEGPVAAHAVCLQMRPTSPRHSARLPIPAGRRLRPDEIAVAFALAVGHLIKGEDIGGSREEGGTGLAAWFGLERRTAHNRVSRLLELLPPDDRGDEQLARWAKALRWAKCYRDLQRWAKSNGWPWRHVLTRLRQLSPRR